MGGALLFLIPAGGLRDSFTQHLQDNYPLLYADDAAQAAALLREKRDEIVAVLIALELAQADDYAAVRQLGSGDPFNAIPLIAVTDKSPARRPQSASSAGCLS